MKRVLLKIRGKEMVDNEVANTMRKTRKIPEERDRTTNK